MKHRQIISHQRYAMQALRKQGLSLYAIARNLTAHPPRPRVWVTPQPLDAETLQPS